MIRALRWKVVAMFMALITVVLAVVLTGVYFSSRRAVADNATHTLTQALDSGGHFGPQRPGSQGGNAPYFVADVRSDGTVVVSGSDYFDLDDEEELLEIINAALERREDGGVLEEYSLRYQKHAGELGTLIAFADSSLETETLRSMAVNLLLGGVAALLALFVCSYLLSGVITRPVARAWESQKRFLSDASHELKTPLTVIQSSAELLRAKGNDPEGYVDNIAAEGARMKSLVDSMLTLSRLEYLPTAKKETVDLTDLAEEAVMRFQPVAFEAGHELNDAIAEGVALTGDREKLTQAAGVLLDNAIKYAAPGTPIGLTLEKAGSKAVFTVENQGEAIPPEKLAHLFDRFYRADESRTGAEGFGLGLSIAQAIAQAHRGQLRCESDNRSTRFILTLPLNGKKE